MRSAGSSIFRLVPFVAFAALACKGNEQTVSTPAPAVASERDSGAAGDEGMADGSPGFFDDGTTPGQTDPQATIGGEPATAQIGDPGATSSIPTGNIAAQPAATNPLGAVMPQLVQCFQNETCDPEQLVAAMPPATQQALMSAAQEYEQTGGGPLAPYAAQAEAAGIDLSELLY